MPLSIYTIENKENFLRTPSLAVDLSNISNPEMQNFFVQMKEILHELRGAGLAAPQVGLHSRIICICAEYSPTKKEVILLNPRVLTVAKKTAVAEEGCFSVPGVYAFIERSAKTRVKGFTEKGEKIDIKAKGMLARILQHEIDHLDGVLFIDRIKE